MTLELPASSWEHQASTYTTGKATTNLPTLPPISAIPMAARTRKATPITMDFQRFSAEKTFPTYAPASPPTLATSPPFFLSPASWAFFAASPSFFAAPPIAARSPASMAVLSAAAAAARSFSPLASASFASLSTAGFCSAAVAANPASVAHLNFGSSGLRPTRTSTMIKNPSHTASQSSVLNRVDPLLLSAIIPSPIRGDFLRLMPAVPQIGRAHV